MFVLEYLKLPSMLVCLYKNSYSYLVCWCVSIRIITVAWYAGVFILEYLQLPGYAGVFVVEYLQLPGMLVCLYYNIYSCLGMLVCFY